MHRGVAGKEGVHLKKSIYKGPEVDKGLAH